MASTTTIIVAQAETAPAADVVTHDATTPVTGEATTAHEGAVEHATFPPFKPETFASQLLWIAITFGALYLIISRIAVPQIGSVLDKRRTRIEGDLKEADRLRVETERAAQAYETALTEARQRAHGIAEETRQGIRTDLAGKRAAVESGLSAKMAEAESSIQASKTEALRSVGEIATDTAAALVAQLTGEVPRSEIEAAVAQAAAKG